MRSVPDVSGIKSNTTTKEATTVNVAHFPMAGTASHILTVASSPPE